MVDYADVKLIRIREIQTFPLWELILADIAEAEFVELGTSGSFGGPKLPVELSRAKRNLAGLNRFAIATSMPDLQLLARAAAASYHVESLPPEAVRQRPLTYLSIFMNQNLSRVNQHYVPREGLPPTRLYPIFRICDSGMSRNVRSTSYRREQTT